MGEIELSNIYRPNLSGALLANPTQFFYLI